MHAGRRPLKRRLGIAMLASCASMLVVAEPATAQEPVNISDPTVTGSAVVGQQLNGNDGTWTGADTITRQWERSDGPGVWDPIPGATSTTYTVTSGDFGRMIRLAVTATNGDGSVTEASEPTAPVSQAPPVNSAPPTISGSAVEGEVLTSNDGTWSGADNITRRWQRSDGPGVWDPIPGATSTTYTLTANDVGRQIRLEVTASNQGGSETLPSNVIGPVAAAPEPDQSSLNLFVPRRPTTHRRATIRVAGVADSPFRLWVYENRRGKACPATPAEAEGRARVVIADLQVSGAFDEERFPMMKKAGRHTFCAYLGPGENNAEETSFVNRRVRKPLLKEGRAQRTVATALRKHGFADRVIANLQESCARQNRSKFECQFSSAFPGYRLTGSGSVVLRSRLSYRFPVSVQGRSFVLTDENEGAPPG